MLNTITIRVSQKSGGLTRVAAFLLLLALASTVAAAQDHQIRIIIINAKNNQPITDEKLDVTLAPTQTDSAAMTTDKDGIILVSTRRATTIRILSSMHTDCRQHDERNTNYSIADILNTGITVGNHCTDAKLVARPGELVLFEIPVVAAVQPAQVKIRIINAKTNQPVTDEQLNVALRADQIGSVAMPTDKSGIILVDTGKATTIRILSNMYADCRSRWELYTDYSIATIFSTGITTGNLCSDAKPPAKPGELILFEIPKTYIPTMHP
jgi:hypothetical protein